MPEYLAPSEDEVEQSQESEKVTLSALAILAQSEHAAMVQTANTGANRRRLGDFDSKLMSYANHSQPVALQMFYSLPRSNKQIIGPSVRFSEIVAPCWRNCAVAGRVVGDAAVTVTAQGVFVDYELNVRNSVEVPRRITDSHGKRYSDDMVITTSNAAMSVARRNAVLKGGVPQALWTPAYESAQLTAVGKNETHAQRVTNAMDFLSKMGLTEWQILNAVGVPGIRELETEHLVTLRVLLAEIKRGDKTLEQVFGSLYDKEIDALFTQLKLNTAQQGELRRSHLGRAEVLVKHLRDRVGPVVTSRPVPVPTTNLDDLKPKATQESPSSLPKADLIDFYRPEPTADALPDANQEHRAIPDDAPQTAGTPEADQALFTQKKRGRPTREAKARQAAMEQQGPAEADVADPVEQDDQPEPEVATGRTDQFAF